MNDLASRPPAQGKPQWASTAGSPIGAGRRAVHRIPRTAQGSRIGGGSRTRESALIAHHSQAQLAAQRLLPSSGDKGY